MEIPPHILSEIWEDNMKFIRDKRLFAKDYVSFISNLLQLPIPGTDGIKTTKVLHFQFQPFFFFR